MTSAPAVPSAMILPQSRPQSPGRLQDELERIFAAQRAASRLDPFPSEAVRRDRLTRLIDLLCTNQDQLCSAVVRDFGRRSAENTKLFDILPPINALKYAAAHLTPWLRPRRRRSNFPYNWVGGKSFIQFVPLGVVGNIAPWNFPLTLALSPMGGILAAGNRVMLKPSEFTPMTSDVLRSLIAQYFAEDEIHVVTGGADVAARFAALPFDHLLFTGSTPVGRRVAQAAAVNLVPVTLELGGKSPVLVSESAHLSEVASKVMFAKSTNAGQICLAPDYVLVHRSRRDALVSELKKAARALYPNGAASKDYVNIITERHAQRLRAHLEDAAARGNPVIPLFDGPESEDPRCLAPRLVLIGGEGGSIMEEEIFGPVLPVVAVDGMADAIHRVGSRARPLAVYYFGNNRAEIELITREVACGGLVINDLMMHFLQDDLPFGGVGDSGMGGYHGPEGFERFSHAKSVFKQSNFADIGQLLRPPYGARTARLLKMQIRR
ncbi:MAG TPA: aldehyde dehydrogenase family protein [Steroidobacteraceae bacterium]|nr:aldehyde dehydrogenase family protein [Steroidobacteraceae bacterium]